MDIFIIIIVSILSYWDIFTTVTDIFTDTGQFYQYDNVFALIYIYIYINIDKFSFFSL